MTRKRTTGASAMYAGSELTADEVEFARAMETYRRKCGRQFPACSEVLAVLKSLGYRRVEKAGKLPKFGEKP